MTTWSIGPSAGDARNKVTATGDDGADGIEFSLGSRRVVVSLYVSGCGATVATMVDAKARKAEARWRSGLRLASPDRMDCTPSHNALVGASQGIAPLRTPSAQLLSLRPVTKTRRSNVSSSAWTRSRSPVTSVTREISVATWRMRRARKFSPLWSMTCFRMTASPSSEMCRALVC